MDAQDMECITATSTALKVSRNERLKPSERAINGNPEGSVSRARIQTKRSDYLEWDEYFMAVAQLSAERSKDPSTQVGACITDADRRVVAIGYNGMPAGCPDDEMPWGRRGGDPLRTKYPYVCHAEMNAILNRNSAHVRGCTMYASLFPCNGCAKMIVQSGIARVVYASDKYHDRVESVAARRLLDMAGIAYEPFRPSHRRVVVDLRLGRCSIEGATAGGGGCGAAAAAAAAATPPEETRRGEEEEEEGGGGKRRDYIGWTEYFIGVALLSGQRSKDPETQVGACVVDVHRRIVGIGYNGMPRGCSDDALPWARLADDPLQTKYPYVCHAEMNAVVNRNCASLAGCTMYVTRFPCNECAKLILQSGIRRVVYVRDKHPDRLEYSAARRLFDTAGVSCVQYECGEGARRVIVPLGQPT